MSIRRALSLLVFLLSLVFAKAAEAQTFTIIWDGTVLISQGSKPVFQYMNDPYFKVNDVPIMTYFVESSRRTLLNGDEVFRYTATFDSGNLNASSNKFEMRALLHDSGDQTGLNIDSVVWLIGPLGQPDLLFDVKVRGTQITGTTSRTYTLEQLRPQIAADYSELLASINTGYADLLAQAATLNDLAGDLSVLESLKREVESLLKGDIDRVTAQQLDALLAKYPILPADVRASLVRLLEDYKKAAADLDAEIMGLREAFSNAAGSLSTTIPAGYGEPTDATGYAAPAIDAASVGPVTIPDVIPDPVATDTYPAYDRYATAVLEQLDGFINASGQVYKRPQFLAAVRAWRANQAAIQRAFDRRAGVSRRELGAFLDAQSRVTSRIRQFLDPGDWFKDIISVPQSLRLLMDTVFPAKMPDLAPGLKDTINEMSGPLNEGQEAALDMMEAVGNCLVGYDDGDEIFDNYANAVLREVAAVAQQISRAVTGSIPVVGVVAGICEAFTGWPACNQSATKLSISERKWAGADAFASVVFWVGAAKLKRMATLASPVAAATADFKKTFFAAYPHLEHKVWVHHAVPQRVMKLYPGVFTEAEMHAFVNLRGIPNALNSDLHLSKIGTSWSRFYKAHPRGATRAEILEHKILVDKMYGHLFEPPFIVTD